MIQRLIRKEERKNALVAIGKGGRALVKAMPKPVPLHEMRRPVRRALIISVELLVGLLVIGAVFIGIVYQRLERGTIDLAFLVPRIEQAINGQLIDMAVKIDSAFVGKNAGSRSVFFRLRNIALYNKQGEAIANAPLAAVGLSLEALLSGRIAPSQMIFIEPTLDVSYEEGQGLSLTYKSEGAGDQPSAPLHDVIASMGFGGVEAGAGKSATMPLSRAQRVDFMKAVTAAFEEARNRRHTTSYLSQFGVRDAMVRYRQGGREFKWRVPDFVIDMRHKDGGSAIRGFGRLWVGDVADQIPPWSLRFQTQQSDETKDLRFDLGVREVTMQSLVNLVPALVHLQSTDMPISAKLSATMTPQGELRDSFANIQLNNGSLAVPRLGANAVGFDGSELKLAYSHKGRRLHILPSPLVWGESKTMLSGVVEPLSAGGIATSWKFALKLGDTRLASADFGLSPMLIDDAWLTGSYSTQSDVLTIDACELRAGSAVIKVNGSVERASSDPVLLLNGQLKDIPLALAKRLWPSSLLGETRQWVGENMIEGRISSGRFRVDLPTQTVQQLKSGGDISPEMVDVELKLGDVVFNYRDDLLPMNVPEAQLTVSGRKLVIAIPEGRVELASGQALRLSQGRFEIADLREDPATADISFRVAGSGAETAEYLNQAGLRYVDKAGLGELSVSGDVSGSVKVRLPLKKNLVLADTSIQGQFRVVKLKAGKSQAGFNIDGGSVDVTLSEKAIKAEGGVVIKTLPAKLHWQRSLVEGEHKQTPLRFSAVLNSAERKALGLTIVDRYVSGDVPVSVSVETGEGKPAEVQVRADLTAAQLDLGAAQWRKSAGAPAVLQFDVVPRKSGELDLSNLSLVGNEFTMEGEVKIDGKGGTVTAFEFPNVSYRLITTMSVSGQRRDDGIMAISAKIKSLDGRSIIRPIVVSPGGETAGTQKVVAAFDHDLVADIDVIVGDQGAEIKGAHIDARRRNGELEWLDFKGKIRDNAIAAVRIEREENGKRYLKAESQDAGSVFRLLGLYPNVEDGQLSLKIDLEEDAGHRKTGTLWMRNFALVGTQLGEQETGRSDPFREGLTATAKSGTKSLGGKSRVLFEQLKAPFSYGNGQFELGDSYINGPVVGATLRGAINFDEERLKLTGTYVPLYGLNSAVGEIPLLSELLIGRKGEGVFGVTFAIEGPTSQPVMMVNPVSLLAPGVLRQIFDFAGEKTPAAGAKARRRQPATMTPMLQ